MAASLKAVVWLGFAASAIVRTARAAVTVNSTILILARNSTAAQSGVGVLQGYGIPYQVVDLSAANSALPKLNTTPDAGSFGGIVTVSAQSYTNGDDWNTVISSQQWQDLYRYQEAFGVRLVRLNAWPSEKDFGVQSVGGAVTADQPIAITNSKDFAGANLVDKAQMSTPNLSKYPAKITNASFATEIAQFGSGTSTSTAAIINKFPSGREQQVWFTTFDLSQTSSTLLSHAWINWLTRGLYLGFRRVYLSTQVDDVFVMTELYQTGKSYRFGVNDLKEHVTWMAEVNSKLPAGSSYMIELGHNGNGNIEEAVEHDYDNDPALCDPQEGVEYPDQTDGPPEYMKPIGTGKDLWDRKFKSFSWSLKCSQLDPLFAYLYDKTNAKKYFHVSHTFTHEDETNATYADVVKEISWNQEWFKRIGFTDSSFSDHFSPNGLIPPGITGLHNGDAIRAWLEKNITYAVGDNSRPVLMDVSSRKSPFHPIITNVKENGYAGAYIIGRYGSSIYYNCDLPNCTNTEWKAIAGGSGDFNAQLEYEKNTNAKYLLGLRWDPYMFHQANMRVSDTTAVTLLGKNKKWSLLMAWAEAVVYEVTRLTQWPIITLKHDAIATAIISRKTRDECNPTLSYTLSSDRASITGITVSAADKNCKVEIPVTLPGDVADSTSGVKVRKEQVGKDPVTVWVGLQGKEGVFALGSAVKVK